MKIPKMKWIKIGEDWKSLPESGPAWYQPAYADGRLCRPLVRCKCGQLTGIGLHHVYEDGKVEASFFHAPDESRPKACGWHEWIELEDYDGGEFLPNEQVKAG